MRTKTLLLTAALSAAGLVSSMAQTNVYSVNAVGYVNKTLPVGFSLLANPLNNSNNTLRAVLANAPAGTQVYTFNSATQSYDDADTSLGEGEFVPNPDKQLPPGIGFFINVPSAATITFIGEVPQGNLTTAIPQNFSLRASQVPQSGGLSSALGFPGADGDQVYLFDETTQRFSDAFTFFGGDWVPSEPTPEVAEAFFVFKAAPANWTRNFSVNQQ